MKRFSDFAPEIVPIDGDKMKIDEVLNKEIIVTGYNINDSKYSHSNSQQCLKLQFELEKEKFILFSGSTVLLDQIEKYKSEIPFSTTIKKVDKYYSFS